MLRFYLSIITKNLENLLDGRVEAKTLKQIECFFNSSTRLTEIPTQVLCQCKSLKQTTFKQLEEKVLTETPIFSHQDFGEVSVVDVSADK